MYGMGRGRSRYHDNLPVQGIQIQHRVIELLDRLGQRAGRTNKTQVLTPLFRYILTGVYRLKPSLAT